MSEKINRNKRKAVGHDQKKSVCTAYMRARARACMRACVCVCVCVCVCLLMSTFLSIFQGMLRNSAALTLESWTGSNDACAASVQEHTPCHCLSKLRQQHSSRQQAPWPASSVEARAFRFSLVEHTLISGARRIPSTHAGSSKCRSIRGRGQHFSRAVHSDLWLRMAGASRWRSSRWLPGFLKLEWDKDDSGTISGSLHRSFPVPESVVAGPHVLLQTCTGSEQTSERRVGAFLRRFLQGGMRTVAAKGLCSELARRPNLSATASSICRRSGGDSRWKALLV